MMMPTALHDPLPEPAPVGQTAQLKQRVQELEQQVLELQRKLDALHGTDLNSLKRAYTTIAQHIQALDVDSRHISGLVSDFETSMLTPNFIAQEVGILASAATAVYVLDRGFRMVRLPLAGALSQAVIVSALGVLSWRLVMSSGAHVRNFFQRNRAAKQQLQLDWEAVRRRVEIMVQLTAT